MRQQPTVAVMALLAYLNLYLRLILKQLADRLGCLSCQRLVGSIAPPQLGGVDAD
jgi:hypothetical protein